MVAMLGWSPADNKEIVSMDEMIKEFDLNKVHKAGASSAQKSKMVQSAVLQLMSNETILPNSKKFCQKTMLKFLMKKL
jgi:glutamyl-tRNA synthetase